ncbi:MAG: hypothetical protein F6K03_10165 [Kamptonema sp. SIO4C4]|nr:hypothetical protein [Kamptonema sp. SIO4C4]
MSYKPLEIPILAIQLNLLEIMLQQQAEQSQQEQSLDKPESLECGKAQNKKKQKDGISPPDKACELSQEGIEIYRQLGGKQDLGLAPTIAKGHKLTMDNIYAILEFFRSFKGNPDEEGWGNRNHPSINWLSWLMMGGDDMYEWAKTVKRIHDAEFNQNLPGDRASASSLPFALGD